MVNEENRWRVSKAAGVSLVQTGIIVIDTVPRFDDPLNMEALP